MITRWAAAVDPDSPWPEYPRPQLVRATWSNLNGRWDHAFRSSPSLPSSWDGEIVVPFSPEAPLSGVGRQLQPDEWLFYRRDFVAPARPSDGRILLHFGAVDQSCTVWVDGIEVGGHIGGYLPFTLDITAVLAESAHGGSHTLVVRVRDLSETGSHARGKQRLDRGTIWYTAQSGIWQTVWLESVPPAYVERLVVVPDLDAGELEVTVVSSTATTEQVQVSVDGVTVSGIANQPVRIRLATVHIWSPEDPFLYDMSVTLGADRVTSYAAMRSFGVRDGRLLLNGSPYQHIGVLDQGYWPDGLLTPPSDAAMVHDIETMKSLGFTMLRKHVKIEPLRWYAHCDRIGILVWQDMVNGGGRYRHLVANLPATRPIRISDRRHGLFFRDDAAGREEFREEVRQTVRLLQSSPCIAVWTPFNEGWGQFDANDVATEVARLDPTRQVNHVSGWIDQGGGDIRSFHRYVRRWRTPRRDRHGRVTALTEYGGYSLRVADHTWGDKEYGYRHLGSVDALAAAFTKLHSAVIAPTIAGGLAATVYTQLSDVEDELNGLLTWDREVLKVPAEVVRAALAQLHP